MKHLRLDTLKRKDIYLTHIFGSRKFKATLYSFWHRPYWLCHLMADGIMERVHEAERCHMVRLQTRAKGGASHAVFITYFHQNYDRIP
jgi:hypothetical protein